MIKIKICGITRNREIDVLNKFHVDYAGFVFYEKSKRNITVSHAKDLFKNLSPGIKKVAVLVSPDITFLKEIEQAGFDILQIHGKVSKEVLRAVSIPVWYAINISDKASMQEQMSNFMKLPEEYQNKIEGIVTDGAKAGSGKTFAWEETGAYREKNKNWEPVFEKRNRILAGGLNIQNVCEGIRLFQPDIVDVSSGVEGNNGKDEMKIKEFTERVKNYE